MKTKIFITFLLSVAILIAGYFCMNGFLYRDLANFLASLAAAVCMIGIISQIWTKPIPMTQEEFIIQIIEYITSRKKGSKDEFCRKYGVDTYNYCLEHGLIHEPFDSDSMSWEATRLAHIRQSNIEEAKRKGFL